MRRPLRRPLAVAAGTALLLALTACGGDGADEASDEPSISESSDSAADDQPAEGEEVDPAEFVDDMVAGLEASTTAQMTMDMSGEGASMAVEGEVDYTTDPLSMAMTMTNEAMGDEPIEFRIVDGFMYMNMGAMSNGKFLGFDLSDSKNLPPGMGDLGDQMDPLAAFEEFEPALTSATFVGTEDVDGEDLQHYHLVLDSSKMESLQGLPPEAGMPDEVEYDIWFDDEFRIRQMDMTMDMATPIEVQVKMFEWGAPVEIEAPPADQVVDPTQMAG